MAPNRVSHAGRTPAGNAHNGAHVLRPCCRSLLIRPELGQWHEVRR